MRRPWNHNLRGEDEMRYEAMSRHHTDLHLTQTGTSAGQGTAPCPLSSLLSFFCRNLPLLLLRTSRGACTPIQTHANISNTSKLSHDPYG